MFSYRTIILFYLKITNVFEILYSAAGAAASGLWWAACCVAGYCATHVLQTIICILLINIAAHRARKWYIRNRQLPPGPWSLPILGYLPFLGVPHHTFLRLCKKYGACCSVQLGSQLVIIISDYKFLRKVFSKEEFTGRPVTPLMKILNGLGIINSAGRLWKTQRRFLHDKLRDFGMTYIGYGNSLMEDRIKNEVGELLYNLDKANGAAIDANHLFALGVSNVICGITMSVHFTNDDRRFKRLNFLIEEGMRLFGEIHYGEYIPFYNYLPGKARAQKKIASNRDEMFSFYQNLIDEHKGMLDADNTRDLIDVYLVEIEKAKSEGRADELFEGKDHELQIKQVLGDLFSAGTETIKSTLLWLVVFMLRNPEAMRKVQKELDDVVGRGRLPGIKDMHRLPITESTIMETLRMSNIVPLATPHSPTKDVYIDGYLIPAGCHVVPLINFIHMDPKFWPEPNKFTPERFFDSNGNVKRPDYFMPFGVGRRMCLGDILARMELFLFFSAIAHQYDFKMEDGESLPTLEGTIGATIAPKSFKVKFVARNTSKPSEIPITLVENANQLRQFGAH